MPKSSVEEIRARFDNEVERFANLETGQSATVDSPLCMELISQAASSTTSGATSLLDIGCGAGNYTVKMLQRIGGLSVTLIDLSRPMLDRAVARVTPATTGKVTPIQGDIRELALPEAAFDIVVAAAVFHHLREEKEWRQVFSNVYHALRRGGSFWISDLIAHSNPAVQSFMWERYGDYLTQLKNPAYRDFVLDYVNHEDSPRSLMFQMDLLREVGFREVELLHKNNCFAAFGAIKGQTLRLKN